MPLGGERPPTVAQKRPSSACARERRQVGVREQGGKRGEREREKGRRTHRVRQPHDLPHARLGLDAPALHPPLLLGLVRLGPPDEERLSDGLLAEDALLLAQAGQALEERLGARHEGGVERRRGRGETLRVELVDEGAGGDGDVTAGERARGRGPCEDQHEALPAAQRD